MEREEIESLVNLSDDMREGLSSENKHGKEIPTKKVKKYKIKKVIIISVSIIAAVAALTFAGIKLYPKYDFNKTQKAAEAGDAAAQARLGLMYYNGKNIKRDHVQGVRWFEKSAEQYNADGLYGLGHAYLYGQGKDKDSAKAVELLKKASQLGNSKAMVILGRMYLFGDSLLKKDYAEAEKLFFKALDADKDNNDAKNNLILIFCNGWNSENKKDYVMGFKYAKSSAEAGNPLGYRSMGVFYEGGYGVEKDYKKAFKYYAKCAKHGGPCHSSLGNMYQKGRGVKENYSKALENFQKAFDYTFVNYDFISKSYTPDVDLILDDVETIYYKGNKDEKSAAFEYMRKVSLLDIPQAMFKFAKMLVDKDEEMKKGGTVSANGQEIIRLVTKAAEKNYVPAQSYLGKCYLYGDYVPTDYAEALKWVTKAAEAGDEDSLARLAEMYENGQGVRQDRKKAFDIFSKLVEKGYVLARHKLAYFYRVGYGTDINIEKSCVFLKDLFNNYKLLPDMQLWFADCLMDGTGVEQDYEKALDIYILN